jgi:hypothetical protein
MNAHKTIFDLPHEVVSSHLVTHQYTDGKGQVRTVSYIVEIWRIKN